MAEKKLKNKKLFFYGISEMPISIASLPLLTYLPNYYGSDVGISLAAIGTVWLVARIFDAFTDPLIGYLGDRTKTRWGRRRVWMVASIPILVPAVYFLFFPNEETVTATYLLFWLAMFWLGWTMLLIPYYAWAAELSPDYNERTTITAWRSWLGMAGNVLSKSIPTLALFFFAYGGTREVVQMIGIFMIILIPLTILLTVFNVDEKIDYVAPKLSLLEGLKIMWKNSPFKRLVLAFFLHTTGVAVSSATFIFFIRGVLQEEKAGIALLLSYYIITLFAIPLWVIISKKIGKHWAWTFGLLCFVFTNPFYMLLGPGDIYWMMLGLMITGFGGATSYVIPHSMKADVIDLDKLNSGEDRAASFFAVWSFITKISYSFGPWFAFMMLAYIGFDPTPGIVNEGNNVLGLKLVYSFSTSIFFVATILVLYKYPLTQARHEELRKELEEKASI
mgnify:FL=1